LAKSVAEREQAWNALEQQAATTIASVWRGRQARVRVAKMPKKQESQLFKLVLANLFASVSGACIAYIAMNQ
jgi:hypothetical protein